MAEQDVLNAAVPEGDVAEPKVNAEVSEPAGAAEAAGEKTEPQAKPNERENDDDEHPRHKRKGGFQRTIERQEKLIERLIEAVAGRTPAAEPPKSEPEKPKAKPQPEDFRIENTDTFDQSAYLEALADWKLDQRLADAEKRREQQERERQAKTEQQRVVETFVERQEAARTKYADYDDVVGNEDVVLTPAMQSVILQSEQGADLAYYLGKNPDEAAAIAKLDPLSAARRLGAIESRLAEPPPADPEPKADPEPPPQSKAPKPPTPVTRPAAAKASDEPLDSDSPEEFRRKLMARFEKKRQLSG